MAVGNSRNASFSMRVSSKAHYGLRMMTELAKAYGRGPRSLAEVARVEHLPLAYLEQLAGPMRRGGLIEATRGAHGGYVLSRRPEEITVLDVITLVEGEVAPVECVAHDYEAGCCVRETDCASRTLWQRLKESVDAVLSGTTLEDLVCDRPPVAVPIPLEDVRDHSPGTHVHEAAHV
ncbi:MAG TPA: RrF2 family transcriptional regulator [Candidatus Dormibacteraeota bacterium]|jgi:Rrf2 family protein|nr:RrF2 family transcriptional regulator [Candidatus Dormibacteraeota bacterium]